MLKACIIDDEPQSVELLQVLLNQSDTPIQVIGTAKGVKEGLNLVKKGGIDVLFLDIEMPDGTGFDLLDQVEKVDFEVIFVTSYNQYAIKAFRYAALDYLLKPTNPTDLKDALGRLKGYNTTDGRIQMLLNNHKSINKFRTLAVATTTGINYYEVDNIVRCEAEGSYTNLYMQNHKPVLASKSLKEYEAILPEFFFRVHKSHLVNLKQVLRFEIGDHPHLHLKDNSQVVVSRRRKNELSARLSSL